MQKNTLYELTEAGQSVWLDFITRDLVRSGELKNLIEENGVRGVTVNPTIFEQAIVGSNAYANDCLRLANANVDPIEVYHQLMISDVTEASQLLLAVFDATDGLDGYVSMEVAPEYARSALETVREARELAGEADNPPNIMIKVPGTTEGLAAIEKLTAENYNVNVTLLFSPKQYTAVAETYMTGLERRLAQGKSVSNIASVASLFVSRIDTMIDEKIDARITAGDPEATRLESLRGKIATSTAKMTYQAYRHILDSNRWRRLADNGAQPQRVLWASTSAKDPMYPDTKYVEALIGPDTVDTMPMPTLKAFLDHGQVKNSVGEELDEAQRWLAEAEELGFNLNDTYHDLQNEGIRKFEVSYKHLIKIVSDACRRLKAA